MKRKLTILIIGAGICGLSIGWEAVKSGANVKIYDKNTVGGGATSSSGGMLAAGIENEPGESSLWQLTRYAQTLWPEFLHNLEHVSGMRVNYRNFGTMMIATNRDELEHVHFLYRYQKTLGVNVTNLSSYEISRREPHLKTVGGLYYPGDHQVDSVRLSAALEVAIGKFGGSISPKVPVKGLWIKGDRVVGITLLDGTCIAGDAVVVCAGVHCTELEGIDSSLALRPLKGQMLALHMKSPLIDHVVWTPRTYLIPKSCGTLIIGATVEERGFDQNNTAGGILSLLTTAWRALPAIEDLPFKKMWVGHRPTMRDDAPILGRLSHKNAYIATGHHRNGILLAPATGKILSELILDNKASPFLDTFSVERFKESSQKPR